jgi:hypothetical protein
MLTQFPLSGVANARLVVNVRVPDDINLVAPAPVLVALSVSENLPINNGDAHVN